MRSGVQDDKPAHARVRISIRGLVQGVGFRPFVYRLATELGLRGWVNNTLQGVCIEAEGAQEAVDAFMQRIGPERPPRAAIYSLETSLLDPVGYGAFEIRESDAAGATSAIVLPDIATCEDCLREVMAPSDRRHRYPFTNCTNCGPRFSIIRHLPYDRPNTTMAGFTMCRACQAEYDDPLDRRFHAQPNACPDCGPQLELWGVGGEVLARRDDALRRAEEALLSGRIVALKGLGGFHLMADARDSEAVIRLRARKHREEKPLAVMFPSLSAVAAHCDLSAAESRLLSSPERPIVLVRRREADDLSPAIAPGNPYVGALLPYTPLHHLLLADLGFPVVATSGNLSDEPICTDPREALERLRGVADLFLVHDRPIARHVDDSVARIVAGRELMIRRARGYAPLPVHVTGNLAPTLAVGAHLKNAVALSLGAEVFVSQHIGDLETEQSFAAFTSAADDLPRLYSVSPGLVACDLHPDYLSTQYAQASGLPVVHVQHHLAHVLSCMAENELEPPALGVAWDGTGYGLDGTPWGGEFLVVGKEGARRVAHFRPVPLPGGDRAAREPRRVALAMLFGLLGDGVFDRRDLAPVAAFTPDELSILRTMLLRRVQTPDACSVGRLFDAVSSLLGIRQVCAFEGQAAMELEFALPASDTEDSAAFDVRCEDGTLVLDWAPVIEDILQGLARGSPAAELSARFHNGLVGGLLEVACQIGLEGVVLSGGCFQNRYLTEKAVGRLSAEGFRPYWHQRVPPNDGGIALGQVVGAARMRMWENVPGSAR
jgi:hydrogenase maturation protein HypF